MDFEKDLGLEFLMNNKKKVPSDTISITSRSLSDRKSDTSDIAEQIDVKEHLVPPSPKQSYSEEDDASYEEEDEGSY